MTPELATRGRSGYVVANGLRLHYLEYGDGEPALVVVPGITSPAITWEFVAERLAERRRVVVLDVRGRGLSGRGGSYRLEDYAEDVAGLIAQLGLREPVLLGHSMGARIVAAFGARHPGTASALVVVDPPLTGPGRQPYPFPLHIYIDSLHEAQAGATADDLRRYFPTWTDEQLRLRAEWLPTCDERAIVETYENFHREDFLGYWKELRGPLLFVYGGESPVVPEAGVQEVAEANPAAALAGVPGAGHMIPWDQLERFIGVVEEFVARG